MEPTTRPAARGLRWAPVSGSANIDTAYRNIWNKPGEAYRYICWCQLPFPRDDDGEDEEDCEDAGEDEDAGDAGKKKRCDGGKTCLCLKPAQDHPDHQWITTYACRRKFFAQNAMLELRCPDNFRMHTYQDHEGYGVVEMIENLLLDFVEVDGNWREQWVVCETLAFFLQTDMIEPMMMVDDPDSIRALIRLVGRTFLAMLARLEREQRLVANSEVRNLALIMSMFAKIADEMRISDLLERGEEDTIELEGTDGETQTFTFHLDNFDDCILGYAERHNIVLPGESDVEGMGEKCPIPTREDPWNTAAAFKEYEKEFGRSDGTRQPAIGGDRFDITTWSSAERRGHSLTGRDPLSKREIAALKMGLVMISE
ncbi:hypothetical protein MFIFM68171_07053 [Madurella fahalii]|uniref:Uncharacterized protein n=1 Tax=Madurella fahalii TaxID=1157608 RepID=A0ABQ0GGG2_9PEZI